MIQTVKKVLRTTGVAMSLSALVTMVPVVTQAVNDKVQIDIHMPEGPQETQRINIKMPETPQGQQLTINGKPINGKPIPINPMGNNGIPANLVPCQFCFVPRTNTQKVRGTPPTSQNQVGSALASSELTVQDVVRHWLSPTKPDGAEIELNAKSESLLREISITCPGKGTLYIEGRASLRNKAWTYRLRASLSIKTTTSDVTSTYEYEVESGGDIAGVVVAEYECGADGENQVVTFSGQGEKYKASNYSLAITYYRTGEQQ